MVLFSQLENTLKELLDVSFKKISLSICLGQNMKYMIIHVLAPTLSLQTFFFTKPMPLSLSEPKPYKLLKK